MSDPIDLSRIRTYPLGRRRNKFSLTDMIPLDSGRDLDSPALDAVAEAIRAARAVDAPVIAMLGGAVIKVGCSALLIDLVRRGAITHIAGNGAVSIHDFELALIGATSEDVPRGLEDGTFGMAEETGRMLNVAIRQGFAREEGYGRAVGRMIEERALPHREYSILYAAHSLERPATIHVAIGGDIIHQHPHCDGAALGATSYCDFRLFCDTVSRLTGGVLLNIGSAVLLPEVFLKALTIANNLGYAVRDFTVANFDFLDMYRPRTRLLEWPRALGCATHDIRANHNRTIPGLHRRLTRER
jgi:hypothetical protein